MPGSYITHATWGSPTLQSRGLNQLWPTNGPGGYTTQNPPRTVSLSTEEQVEAHKQSGKDQPNYTSGSRHYLKSTFPLVTFEVNVEVELNRILRYVSDATGGIYGCRLRWWGWAKLNLDEGMAGGS